MSVETALVSILTADTNVTALVSSRVRPIDAWQEDALPYIVYNVVSGGPVQSIGGPTGTYNRRVQVDILDDHPDDVKTLAGHVRGALDGVTSTAGSVTISSIMLLDENDGFDNPADDSEVGVYRVIQDYSVWYR